MTMVTPEAARPYVIDPNDPRAPSMELWNAMTEAERRRIAEALPGRKQCFLRENADELNDDELDAVIEVVLDNEDTAECRTHELKRQLEGQKILLQEERKRREVLEQELVETRAELERLRKGN